MKILLERTDENHSMTMNEIIEALDSYGIPAERKSLYNDIENLELFGLDIIKEQKDRGYYYAIGSRDFELAELKLLVDAVQSSKFITEKKSNELIRKISGFTSKYEASMLKRQVYMNGRAKTINENIYYNVDLIHDAINTNQRIKFQYFQWNVDKKMELKHDGAYYEVSPWALTWDDENYYLVAYDEAEDKIKHFRVDKMLHIESIAQKRNGRAKYTDLDIAAYSKKMFGMYDGKDERIKLLCENHMANVIIDRFGKDVTIIKVDDEHFTVGVEVAFSRQFIGWVFALGEAVKIVGPESAVERMKEETQRLMNQYLG